MFQRIIEQKYYHGAQMGFLQAMADFDAARQTAWINKNRNDWMIYYRALLEFASANVWNAEQVMLGAEIGYRNHKQDKKGNLVSVEAYVVG